MYPVFSSVVAARGALFGRGRGYTIIDDLRCTGTEFDIAECRSLPWFVGNCDHSEDAGVFCRGMSLKVKRSKW